MILNIFAVQMFISIYFGVSQAFLSCFLYCGFLGDFERFEVFSDPFLGLTLEVTLALFFGVICFAFRSED